MEKTALDEIDSDNDKKRKKRTPLMNYAWLYKTLTRLHSAIPYTFATGYALPPLNLFFELTYRCNLRCEMCQFLPLVKESQKIIQKQPDLELSLDEVKNTISQFPSFSLITLTGGEPFLRKDIIDILQFTAKRNKCHLISNGTAINEQAAAAIVSCGSRHLLTNGLVMLEISLEGTKEVHDRITAVKGSYDKTIATIQNIVALKKKHKKKFPLINIATVITKNNISVLPEMVLLAKRLDVDILSFLTYSTFAHYDRLKEKVSLSHRQEQSEQGIISKKLLQEQIDAVVTLGKEHSLQIRFSPHGLSLPDIIDCYSNQSSITSKHYACYSPWTKVIITSCGDVMPCSNSMIGNIREQNFSSLWNGKKAKQFRNRLKRNGIFSTCVGCCMLEKKR